MNQKSTTTPAADRYARSTALHEKARQLMPGGVNSPVRAYQSIGRDPIIIREGAGCTVTDVDGNAYIDYVGSFGPLIVGHAHEKVIAAILKTAKRGTSFGMPTELESHMAAAVIDAVPSVEVVRFVNSGTEATMSALRVARGFTGRSKIVKCIGGYHGHADGLLVSAGSGATTLGVPSSPGVPESITSQTLLLPYNNTAAAEKLFEEQGDDIAAIIIEPIAGNMGCVPPEPGYLEDLREMCNDAGTVLIFDEVMCGFRVAYGGAQSLYGIRPDMTAMGKIIGGGMPCAAYGGREDIMRQIAPDGPVYQAGTLSGNPVAMAAGLATLELLREPGTYKRLETLSARLADGLRNAAEKAGVDMQLNRVGSMLTPFFTTKPVTDYDTATASDTAAFATFFGVMLDEGVVLPPSQFEAWFVSLAHDEKTIDQTIAAAQKAFRAVAAG